MRAKSCAGRECEDVMRRIYRLPVREQLMVFRMLREYLGGQAGDETVFEKEIRERQGALDAMRRVAEHLHLAEDIAPSSIEYKQAPKAVTQGWSLTKVGRAWGRYRLAQQAYRGEHVPSSVSQRSLRRSLSGRKQKCDTHLNGLRAWLATGPHTKATRDYDAFVKKHNSDLVLSGHGSPFVSAYSVRCALGLGWDGALALAEDDADQDALRERFLRERIGRETKCLPVIGVTTTALLLGRTVWRVRQLRRMEGFPTPVLRIRGRDGWYLEDIEAYKAGDQPKLRELDELRPMILDSHDMSRMLGVGLSAIFTNARLDGSRVPPPDGYLGPTMYWLREPTEARLAAARPFRRGKSSRTKTTSR